MGEHEIPQHLEDDGDDAAQRLEVTPVTGHGFGIVRNLGLADHGDRGSIVRQGKMAVLKSHRPPILMCEYCCLCLANR